MPPPCWLAASRSSATSRSSASTAPGGPHNGRGRSTHRGTAPHPRGAGGVEGLCYGSFVGFDRAGRRGQRPVPCDARRDGFALAEGAAALMLEDAEAAAARGARLPRG